MRYSVRRVGLFGALIATLLAGYFAPEQRGEGVVLTERAARETAPAASPATTPNAGIGQVAVLDINPRTEPLNEDELFKANMTTKPVPVLPSVQTVTSKSAVQEVPTAPPVPLKMIGRYVEDGHEAVFVQFNDLNLVLHKGDVVADQYKVEQIDDGSLTLRYLPLNQVQTISLNPSN